MDGLGRKVAYVELVCLGSLNFGLHGRVEQVAELVVVDLEGGELERERVQGLKTADLLEDELERARQQAGLGVAALHGEGLARAGLSVRDHRALLAVDGALHKRPHRLEQLFLARLLVEHPVEVVVLLPLNKPNTLFRHLLSINSRLHALSGLIRQKILRFPRMLSSYSCKDTLHCSDTLRCSLSSLISSLYTLDLSPEFLSISSKYNSLSFISSI